MEQTWKLGGVYFDWELTVRVTPTIDPPKQLDEDDMGKALGRMKRVDRYFMDMVNLYEYVLHSEG